MFVNGDTNTKVTTVANNFSTQQGNDCHSFTVTKEKSTTLDNLNEKLRPPLPHDRKKWHLLGVAPVHH